MCQPLSITVKRRRAGRGRRLRVVSAAAEALADFAPAVIDGTTVVPLHEYIGAAPDER